MPAKCHARGVTLLLLVVFASADSAPPWSGLHGGEPADFGHPGGLHDAHMHDAHMRAHAAESSQTIVDATRHTRAHGAPGDARRIVPDLTIPKERRYNDAWQALHEDLAAEIEEERHTGQPRLDVLLYGDSITESWRGTSMDQPIARTVGMTAAFESWRPPKEDGSARALPAAISGDTIPLLTWRLQNGEAPPTGDREPKSIVVLIGTNDLARAAKSARGGSHTVLAQAVSEAVPRIADEGIALMDYLLSLTERAVIYWQALLPRGEHKVAPADLGEDTTYEQPGMFTAAIESLNKAWQEAVAARERMVYVDCGYVVLARDGASISVRLMPDGLHPSAEAQLTMGFCYDDAIRKQEVA